MRVIVFDKYCVESSVFIIPLKLNAFGVVSAGTAKAKNESLLLVKIQSHPRVTMQVESSA